MNINLLVSQIMNGLSFGAVAALVATGLSITFGIQKVVNFAHGTFYALGAYFALLFFSFFPRSIFYFMFVAIVAGILVGLVGVGMEISVLRRIYDSENPVLYSILATFGLMLIIREAITMVWGTMPKTINMPQELSGVLSFNTFSYPSYRIFLCFLALALVFLVWFLIEKTKLGSLVRAAVENPQMTSALGVNVNKLTTLTFLIGVFLAGFGGVLHAPLISLRPYMDIGIIITAFVVVVVGGLGSIEGALIGGVTIGLVRGIVSTFWPPYTPLSMFIVLVIIISIKPEGLVGRRW